MNLKNLLLTVIFFVAGGVISFAQSNILNAKTPSEIGVKSEDQELLDNDKPLPYAYVDDRDILMGKRVWEIVDLNERVNFPLYYPIDTINIGSERRSLYETLVKGIRNGEITEVYGDSYFVSKRSLEDIEAMLSKIDTTDAGIEQFNAGEPISEEYIQKTELTSADVAYYRIMGYWFFDKRQGELKYRMLGLAPVAPDVYTKDKEDKDYVELFWVFFPDAREVLHAGTAFNDRNSAKPISFDDLLNARRFSSVIYKEENVFGDRQVDQYMRNNSQMQLLEADRIKEKIRNFEQDMWNY